jgi:hypothetical protein
VERRVGRAMLRALGVALALAPLTAAAFDVNGVALGAREDDIRRAMPSAHCQPLEWKSRAAERRCDDARIVFAGVAAHVTLYLKGDAVQAFDLRFAIGRREAVMAWLRSAWGAPALERVETVDRRGHGEHRIYRARWKQGRDQALLTAPLDRKRATLSAWRGDFEAEIYRVR